MASPAQSESSMEFSTSTLSPNTTGTGADEDSIGSMTKDFADNFSHKFTPMTWSKTLNTPTPNYAHTINSNMSSVTYMKHTYFNNENDTPMADTNQTPMRDLNPEYQDGPHVNCPLSADSQISSASLESPPVVKVLSPASQFRLKRAVFESRATAVKSPGRKQRAQNVAVLENSPSLVPPQTDNMLQFDISPGCAIESETGDDCVGDGEGEVPVATAHAMPATMKVLDCIMHETEMHEKEGFDELKYEESFDKEGLVRMEKVEPVEVQREVVHVDSAEVSEVLHVPQSSEEPSSAGLSKHVLYFIMTLLFCVVYFSSKYITAGTAVSTAPLPIMAEVTITPLVSPVSETVGTITPLDESLVFGDSIMVPADAELSLSVVYKSVPRIDAKLAQSLYVQFKELCTSQYALLHTKIVEYDAKHGYILHTAAVKLRRQADMYLAVLGESVVQFHHQVDALGVTNEWLKLKHEISTRVVQSGLLDKWQKLKQAVTTRVEAIDTSGIKQAMETLKHEYSVHAPVVKERVQAELHKAQQHTLTSLLHMHRFIKENELLADEFY